MCLNLAAEFFSKYISINNTPLNFPAEKKHNRTMTKHSNGFQYKYHYKHHKPSTFYHTFIFILFFLGHILLGFIGFNKPPIEGNQLPVETNRVHYSFH